MGEEMEVVGSGGGVEGMEVVGSVSPRLVAGLKTLLGSGPYLAQDPIQACCVGKHEDIWAWHTLSSQQRGSVPPWLSANAALYSSMRCHLSAPSSRQEWLMNASTSPILTCSVLA